MFEQKDERPLFDSISSIAGDDKKAVFILSQLAFESGGGVNAAFDSLVNCGIYGDKVNKLYVVCGSDIKKFGMILLAVHHQVKVLRSDEVNSMVLSGAVISEDEFEEIYSKIEIKMLHIAQSIFSSIS